MRESEQPRNPNKIERKVLAQAGYKINGLPAIAQICIPFNLGIPIEWIQIDKDNYCSGCQTLEKYCPLNTKH